MELVAIMLGGTFLALSIIAYTEDEVKPCIIFLLLGLMFQLFWVPVFLEPKIENKTYISDVYNDIVFEEPVKINETIKSFPYSIRNNEIETEIEFINRKEY